MKAFGKLDATAFSIHDPQKDPASDTVLHVPAGAFALVSANGGVLSLPSGELISVQPDGSVQTRPAGGAGPWEQGKVDGGCITYTPDPASGLAFVFGLKDA